MSALRRDARAAKHGTKQARLFLVHRVRNLVFVWRIVKYCIGFAVLICFDWYMALIAKLLHKGYVWRCKSCFSGRKQLYYCHTCGYNFRE